MAAGYWWGEDTGVLQEGRFMGDSSDETQQIGRVEEHPLRWTTAIQEGYEEGKAAHGPRTFGWAHAFMVVGVTFCLSVLAMFILALVFADRLPQP